MNKEWSLDLLYQGYEDPKFQADFASIDEIREEAERAVKEAAKLSAKDGLLKVISCMEKTNLLIYRLYNYVSLRQSVNTTDADTNRYMGQLEQKLAQFANVDTANSKYIASVDNLEEVVETDEVLKGYRFMLLNTKERAKYLLADEVESMISKMNLSGGRAWSNLFDMCTSTLKVDYRGKTITLPEVRNLANDVDPQVRKEAYEAELAAYEKIELPIAFALNHIKSQVKMLAAERGYESPLMQTLIGNSMKRETLEAMFTAMKEYMPKFHEYLKAKAHYLGYEGSLPWYDMFAPVGGMTKEYSLEEAKEILVDTFRLFSDDMAEMMERAFDESWIDFYSREGKVGGAFCAYLMEQKQSRILTNYAGSFMDVDTLAHELGHAFHGLQLAENQILNNDCPMQLAETASTFNETHLTMAMLGKVSKEEERNLLETLISGTTQTVCDIYSRYLFESAVFERCDKEFLMPEDLKAIMLDAQKESYGDGLDEHYLHPYMWACKGHYYSEDLSFYNFPYAFGSLFAMGLYAIYMEEGDSFVAKYRALLRGTATMDTESVAAAVGIDVTKPAFWEKSLSKFAELIDRYVSLLEE